MLKKIIFSIVVFLILLELGAVLITRGFKIYSPPNYVYNNTPKSVDINPHFGVWHFPNTNYIQKKDCLDVVYYFNSIGARDIERTKNGENRFLVLGDSFIEGYGIDTSQRISNILENSSDYEFLNFGTAGGFGSTQMYLSYKYFNDKFEHDKVLVGLFPTNDFSDDSYEFGKVRFNKRYRPYHIPVENSESFKLIYHVKDISDSMWSLKNYKKGMNSSISLIFGSFTHIGSIIQQIKNQLEIKKIEKINKSIAGHPEQGPSKSMEQKITFKIGRIAHHDYISEEYDLLLYNLKKIKELAESRPVYVFTIAARYEIYNIKLNPENNILGPQLKHDLDSLGMQYIDIIGPMNEQYEMTELKKLYLECDGHWSPYGNKIAAEEIRKYIFNN